VSSPGTTDEPIRLPALSAAQLRSARRLLRRKEREESGLFLAEGTQAVREALASPHAVVRLLVAEPERHAEHLLAATAAGVPVSAASEADLTALADTVHPQGLLAVCRVLDVPLADVMVPQARLVVCCAHVRDPGNAGTVIRCADAFGADGVVLTEASVDLYNAKTVRATAGSLFHLPLVTGPSLADTVSAARAVGLQVLAADGAGSVDLPALGERLARPTLWIMGNEAWGLPAADRALADEVVRVPLYGAAESLNLSTAAAVCLYASATAQRGWATVQGR
jgi:RNA methyltransferase, TrmH family